MLATSFVLAASLMGQSLDNSGVLWNGSTYVLTTFDISKPLHFQGGSLAMDLVWQPAMDGNGGGFTSLPFIAAGVPWPVTLQFYSRVGIDIGAPPNTWGFVEISLGGGNVEDYTVIFDPGSDAANVKWTAVPVSATAPRAAEVLWALQRAGVSSFTLTQ